MGTGMDVAKIDQIIQFALARAAHEDDRFDRELGPIHLIKYVYLADLAFARRNGGKTYTGIDWQFFHFGPWSSVVNERIEPAAALIDASLRTFAATEEFKEGKRFSVSIADADALERKLERGLPSTIVSALKKDVHTFGTDTARLLDWVYKTPPMLKAAPREMLDFTNAVEVAPPPVAPEAPPSRRQEKKMAEWLARARQALADNRASRTVEKRERIEPDPIDEVTARGMAWLNEESVVEPASGVARFSEDVWRAAGWRDLHGDD